MGKDDDYYGDDGNFKGYKVTSIDPGYELLILATCYAAICIFVGLIFRYTKKKHDKSTVTDDLYHEVDSMFVNPLTSTKEDGISTNDDQSYEVNPSIEVVDPCAGDTLGLGLVDLNRAEKDFDFIFVRQRNRRSLRNGVRHKSMSDSVGSSRSFNSMSIKGSSCSPTSTSGTATVASRFKKHKEIAAASASSQSHPNTEESKASSYRKLTDDEDLSTSSGGEENEVTLSTEMIQMFKLSLPWSFSEFVTSSASIITIGVISHYIGTAEMLCYSYVWFIMDAAHIVSGALYSSLYKHVNNAAALNTDEGHKKAGKYIRIAILFNFIISIPICIILIFTMGPIMKLYGYGKGIVKLSRKYTYVAAASNFISTTTSFASLVPDIEGHADFDAGYGLVDSGIDIVITMFLIPILQPTLMELGYIHLIQDVVSIIVYYSITWVRNRWFDKYKKGILSPLEFKTNIHNFLSPKSYEGKDKNLVISLISKTIPLTFDAVTAELEWFVLTFFAAHLGAAEVATWILLSYVWGFVGILPNNFASAFEYRISNLLSTGKIPIAKKMASASLWVTSVLSLLSCLVLFFSRHLVVNGIANDDTMREMLLEIIPFIVICDPILSVATAASYLNRALAMYQRSTKLELLLTVFVTIPVATVSTYVMGFNIEGMAAAVYAGYSTMASLIIIVYVNADWERAAEKNKKMSGETDADDDLSDTDEWSTTSGDQV
jgi:Na+-driven multidrug efflux pump